MGLEQTLSCVPQLHTPWPPRHLCCISHRHLQRCKPKPGLPPFLLFHTSPQKRASSSMWVRKPKRLGVSLPCHQNPDSVTHHVNHPSLAHSCPTSTIPHDSSSDGVPTCSEAPLFTVSILYITTTWRLLNKKLSQPKIV